jgi:hypothetical protein
MFAQRQVFLSDLFGDSILNVIYAAALFIGVIYALSCCSLQGIGDALGDLDVDFDIDTDLDLDV